MKYTRLAIVFSFLILALVLQFSSIIMFGSYVSFVLAALIVAAFFLNIFELLFLTLFAVLALKFTPGFSFEFIVFAFLPFVAFAVRRIFPYAMWLVNIAMIAISVIALYVMTNAHYLFTNPTIFALDVAGSTLFGAAIFFLMSWAT